ncbi:MAG: cytochrome P450 [Candidatus Binatia bacterium]
MHYDPFDPAIARDPYRVYAWLRDHHPVYRSHPTDSHVLSRHEDVVSALVDTDRFSSDAMNGVLLGYPTGDGKQRLPRSAARGGLVSVDPPAHSELRRIVNRGFTPRTIREWAKRIDEVVAECLRGVRPGETFDVVEDLAAPLPVTIIAELLGAEPDRRDDFRAWADAANRIMSGSERGKGPLAAEGSAAVLDLAAYLFERIQERMRRPRDDLLSVLVKAHGEDVLSEDEAVGFAALLLFAGSETTTKLIGNAVWALLNHPRELELALADPGRIAKIVEETLRFDGPVQYVFRRATEDVERHGVTIPRNGVVTLLLASANRDPRQFPDPDVFRPDRELSGHVGFGFGTHFCLGAALARAEATSALRQLLPLLDGCEQRTREPTYVDSYQLRGLRHLEIVPSRRA